MVHNHYIFVKYTTICKNHVLPLKFTSWNQLLERLFYEAIYPVDKQGKNLTVLLFLRYNLVLKRELILKLWSMFTFCFSPGVKWGLYIGGRVVIIKYTHFFMMILHESDISWYNVSKNSISYNKFTSHTILASSRPSSEAGAINS